MNEQEERRLRFLQEDKDMFGLTQSEEEEFNILKRRKTCDNLRK